YGDYPNLLSCRSQQLFKPLRVIGGMVHVKHGGINLRVKLELGDRETVRDYSVIGDSFCFENYARTGVDPKIVSACPLGKNVEHYRGSTQQHILTEDRNIRSRDIDPREIPGHNQHSNSWYHRFEPVGHDDWCVTEDMFFHQRWRLLHVRRKQYVLARFGQEDARKDTIADRYELIRVLPGELDRGGLVETLQWLREPHVFGTNGSVDSFPQDDHVQGLIMQIGV